VPNKGGGRRNGSRTHPAKKERPVPRRKAGIIAALNKLIEVCRDADAGFRAAADAVANQDLKGLFLCYAQQRARYVAELQDEVRRLGGEPEESGTLAGVLHRGWVGLKGVLTGGSECSMIVECERGEDFAQKAYEQVLRKSLPDDVRTLVERQAAGVQEAYERIRVLEEVTNART
jgi:uncharacterized protein (TIGR02284 family)